MNDDIDEAEYASTACPKCASETRSRQCDNCDDGYSGHDCGDDTCCCLHPEDNVRCDLCDGHGWNHWCPTCGWDCLALRYLPGLTKEKTDGPETSAD